jgi:predicted aldo/keto reductase-like oxidoreductase
MHERKELSGLNRREFLRIGLAGTTSAILGGNALAEAVQYYASSESEPFAFPKPVYRTLGRTGLRITVVSFGAMLTSEPEVIRLAFDHGINYVDTARKYMDGKNEEIVGKALKGRRDKMYVATKTLPTSKSKEDIIRDVETSLKVLDTDYIDVIQLHNLTDKERVLLPEAREALTRLRDQGKVRFFGVTTHKNQVEVLTALMDDRDRFFDTALVAYNFKSEKEIADVIAKAAKANIGVIAMKTQAGGYTTEELGPISPHQAALKWALQNPNITAAIPGMKDLAQLREDVAVMGMPFKYADERILQRYSAAVEPHYCHFCGKCEASCPMGVEISTINRALMYAEGAYKSRELAQLTYRELPPSAAASMCLQCSAKDGSRACVARCINGLNIAAKMERARQLLG